MERPVTTVIDAELCIGCGECIRVCPSGTLSLVDGKAAVTGTESLRCGHCSAVCPEGAVRVTALDPGTLDFSSFTLDRRWLPHGDFDAGALARLMASRRSCRNYVDKPVDRTVLEDLVRYGLLAPSGTNSQRWFFTILPTRAAVESLAAQAGQFFRTLNRLARNPVVRHGLALVGQPALKAYWRDYYPSVQEGLEEHARTGKDLLFHGAPAAILVGSRPDASCPVEDALLATQNILLGAHALGLGTCLIGFVVEAMKQDRRIGRRLGLAKGERVHAVVAVGHPAETYQSTVPRLPLQPRVFLG